jgi:hypothetical protein
VKWRGVLVAALLAAGLFSSSCDSVRNGLGTRDGLCFSALPAARQVVGSRASFAGVRLLSSHALDSAIRRRLGVPPPGVPDPLTDFVHRPACLVAYRGDVLHRAMAGAWRPEKGPYVFTVVVVRQSDDKVLGVVVLPKAPLRFSHLS